MGGVTPYRTEAEEGLTADLASTVKLLTILSFADAISI